MDFEKNRVTQTFNFPSDEIESLMQFFFLISNKQSYKDELQRNRMKSNKSLALRNFIQDYICKHDGVIQTNFSEYEKFRADFFKTLESKEKKDDNKTIREESTKQERNLKPLQ